MGAARRFAKALSDCQSTASPMTVVELIEKLRLMPQDAPVEMEILEPYDDDAARLREPVTGIYVDDKGVSKSENFVVVLK